MQFPSEGGDNKEAALFADVIYNELLSANVPIRTIECGFFFNRKDKECSAFRLHQDCIHSCVIYVRWLLSASEKEIPSVAERRGYTDSKYVFRQFPAVVGVTPKQYRQIA